MAKYKLTECNLVCITTYQYDVQSMVKILILLSMSCQILPSASSDFLSTLYVVIPWNLWLLNPFLTFRILTSSKVLYLFSSFHPWMERITILGYATCAWPSYQIINWRNFWILQLLCHCCLILCIQWECCNSTNLSWATCKVHSFHCLEQHQRKGSQYYLILGYNSFFPAIFG